MKQYIIYINGKAKYEEINNNNIIIQARTHGICPAALFASQGPLIVERVCHCAAARLQKKVC